MISDKARPSVEEAGSGRFEPPCKQTCTPLLRPLHQPPPPLHSFHNVSESKSNDRLCVWTIFAWCEFKAGGVIYIQEIVVFRSIRLNQSILVQPAAASVDRLAASDLPS